MGDGNIHSESTVFYFASARISRARNDNGTRCSRLCFILSAGIFHSAASRSISAQRAPRTSPDRHAVRTRNSKASLTATTASDCRTVRIVQPVALGNRPLHYRANPLPHPPGRLVLLVPDRQQDGHDIGRADPIHPLLANLRVYTRISVLKLQS